MDIERGIVTALFCDYPRERVIECIEKDKDGNWLLNEVADLMKWRMTHFDGRELEQSVSEFKRICKEEYAGRNAKLWPLLYLARVGMSLLDTDRERPVVRMGELLRWRTLTFDTSEDLLTTSWLAWKEKDRKKERTSFIWEDTLLIEPADWNTLIGQRSLTDIHVHISHSSDAFSIRWVYWMNNCWQRPKMEGKWIWVNLAAIIRYYLFQIDTDGGCPAKEEILRIVEARDGGESLQSLSERIYKKVDRASDNSIKPNIDGIEHWDYALQDRWKVGNETLKQPYMMLAGERWLMYTYFKKLYAGDEDAELFALAFYLYLLIKSNYRKEYIPTNGLLGLCNYQDYEDADREDSLYNFAEPKRRYAVHTSLGQQRKNKLEARVSVAFHKKNTDEQEDEEESPVLEVRIGEPLFGKGKWKSEPLIRRVRLVATVSKKKYSWENREAYLIGLKHDFDRIIERAGRNKRLVKKDFCLVGIDFSSSDEYARPEVFATLVRYARRKGFNNFTYHAGEDFYDIIDGLRTIDEILSLLKWDKHCRLGHAIALGLNAERYYKDRGWTVIATRQVLLDNLSWFLSKQNQLLFALDKNSRAEIENKIRILYNEIGYNEPFDLKKYEASLRLRGDHPLPGIRGEDMQLNTECSLTDGAEAKALRGDAVVKTMFDDYYADKDVNERGSEIIHWKMPKGVVTGIKAIQEALYKEIQLRQISIETCPTSNLIIGPFERYDELPVAQFLDRLPNNAVSVNTDDKGVMATSIEAEYALIAASMKKKKVTDAEIQARMDQIVKGAESSRF